MNMHPIPILHEKAQALRGALLRSRPIESIEEQLDDFLQGVEFLGLSATHEPLWYRARLCENDSPFDNVNNMLYPLNGATTYGRAHYPGSRVLYASWNMQTAIEEIGASKKDLVQIVRLRVRYPLNVPCHFIGNLQFFHSTGRCQGLNDTMVKHLVRLKFADPYQFIANVFVDSVLSEFFRAPVKRPQEYKVSAAFAERYHRSKGGLVYPSVETLEVAPVV